MDDDDEDDALSADEVTRYRRIAARANCSTQDRMDIAYAAKEATRRNRRLEQTRQAEKIRCPITQSCALVQVPESIKESRGVHRLSFGWVQKDEKISVQRMLEQQAGHGDSEFSRTGCSGEGESRCSRDDVIVERLGRDYPGTYDGMRRLSNWDHPTHGIGKGETLEHE